MNVLKSPAFFSHIKNENYHIVRFSKKIDNLAFDFYRKSGRFQISIKINASRNFYSDSAIVRFDYCPSNLFSLLGKNWKFEHLDDFILTHYGTFEDFVAIASDSLLAHFSQFYITAYFAEKKSVFVYGRKRTKIEYTQIDYQFHLKPLPNNV